MTVRYAHMLSLSAPRLILWGRTARAVEEVARNSRCSPQELVLRMVSDLVCEAAPPDRQAGEDARRRRLARAALIAAHAAPPGTVP